VRRVHSKVSLFELKLRCRMTVAEPSSSKKRKADADNGITSMAPPKKVAFAADTKKSKMFTAEEQEELDQSIGQNKAIAKAAKKAKKKHAKQTSTVDGMDTTETAPAEEDEADSLYLGFEKRAKALSLGNVESAEPDNGDDG
jgi:hypothetical protein